MLLSGALSKIGKCFSFQAFAAESVQRGVSAAVNLLSFSWELGVRASARAGVCDLSVPITLGSRTGSGTEYFKFSHYFRLSRKEHLW